MPIRNHHMSTSTIYIYVYSVYTYQLHMNPLFCFSFEHVYPISRCLNLPEADSEQQFLAALDKLCFWDVKNCESGWFWKKNEESCSCF